ncbi:MAG: ABC transporter ATP-binding protein [Vicinamibacterales bacterium]
MSTLTVRDLHTYYGDSHVLQGVTLQAEQGTVTAVLGRNGVGKTTLCRSIAGLTPARAGQIALGATDITRLAPHRIHQARVGLVPQGRRMFTSLTVREHLAIAERSADLTRSVPPAAESGDAGPVAPWTVESVCALFPRLAERLQNRGNELSGGEQQMLAIARALVANPLLLIMDEPTEGLAPALVAQVGELVGRLKREGTTVLLVEQNATFAVALADRVHVMSKGAIVHSSDPKTLWENEEIKTQLLGVPGATAHGERR